MARSKFGITGLPRFNLPALLKRAPPKILKISYEQFFLCPKCKVKTSYKERLCRDLPEIYSHDLLSNLFHQSYSSPQWSASVKQLAGNFTRPRNM